MVRNPRYAEGQASSLAAGLAACSPDSQAAIVLLADQPGIRPEHIRALVSAFRTRTAPAIRLRFADAPGPALLARGTWPELERLEGDVGARVWLEAHPGVVSWVELDEPAPADVDRPEDLARA
ncbi:MAG: hypothetical protein KatS3mg014_1989 [Actinomycetota bacterium]|nr:MAG: hypothetical protein KatS3mg014_1989 [Actinomycetota bacterium]